MKARIGITSFFETKPRGPYVNLNSLYCLSIALAGGLPVVLPLPNYTLAGAATPKAGDYLDSLDGLIIPGGGDVSPLVYGENPSRFLGSVSSDQDRFEFDLIKEARIRGIPILGICRGHQVINVAMGGTLYQDIGTQVKDAHGHAPTGVDVSEPYHIIRFEGKSALSEAMGGQTLAVNSFHHQAVKDMAPGLRVSARSEDGIVEAFENDDGGSMVMGVQFHPEGMTGRFPQFVEIFSLLVKEAEKKITLKGSIS